MSVIREIETHGWRYRFEVASQVLSLDVPEWGFGFRNEPEPLLATRPLAGFLRLSGCSFPTLLAERVEQCPFVLPI